MLPEDRARHEAAESERSRVGKLARHEEEIRRLERERTHRNLLSMLVQPDPHEDPDFPGCVW